MGVWACHAASGPGSQVAAGAGIVLSCHLTPRYLQALTGHENIIRLQNVLKAENDLVPSPSASASPSPSPSPSPSSSA